MRNFLLNLRYKYSRFMMGRYGVDEMNIFLLVLSIVMTLLGRVFFSPLLSMLSWIFLIWCCFRMYSKNIAKRYEEKEKFLRLKNRLSAWYRVKRDAWTNRKTHKYFRCKTCKTSIRVPRGVGKVEVTCPKCKARIRKKA